MSGVLPSIGDLLNGKGVLASVHDILNDYDPGSGVNEETIMDPVIKAGLNILIQRFGYTNVTRVFKAMKPKKGR